MAHTASAAIASSGLCMGISVAVLLSFLTQSPPAAIDGAQAAQLDPAAHMMLAGVASFFASITITYVNLHNGGGGGAASPGDRRILEVMFLILCASVGLMDLSLMCMQPGPVQAPELLIVAAAQQLPYAGAATFYLSLVLTFAHVRAAAVGGAGNERGRAAVELLGTVTLAATLVTGVVSSITAALIFN